MSLEVHVLDQPVSLLNGLGAWVDAVKRKIATRIVTHLDQDTAHLDRYLEFAPLAELPGAFAGCAFFQRDLNDALTRLGIFMGAGKGVRRGTLLRHDDPTLVNYRKLVAGHNVPGDVTHDFYRAAGATDDPARAPNAAERAVRDHVLSRPGLGAKDRFYLIAASVQSTKTPLDVFTHEVFHAYYYLLPEYRDEVRAFWTDAVPAADRAAITAVIGRAYNVEDEDLVIDEFQAYVLQKNAEFDHLRDFVPHYRTDLHARVSRRIAIPLPS